MIRTVISNRLFIASWVTKSSLVNSRKNLSHSIISKKCLKELSNISSITIRNKYRNISYSNRTKSDSKSHETSEDEVSKNALSDQDFQDILKDFAKDFGLNDESQKILEDIKNSMDETEDQKNVSASWNNQNNLNNPSAVKKNKLGEKYKDFSEIDSFTIPSFEELQSDKHQNFSVYPEEQEWESPSFSVDIKRGQFGVFDVDQLVEVLKQENLADITVISIHKSNLADYMILSTAKSPRHSKAVAEYLLKLYKKKKHEQDPFIKIEGESNSFWKVMDMGNIFLHIMLEETRAHYDIESLWLLDLEFDSGGTMKPDPLFEAIKEQMAFFDTLQDVPTTEIHKETT